MKPYPAVSPSNTTDNKFSLLTDQKQKTNESGAVYASPEMT